MRKTPDIAAHCSQRVCRSASCDDEPTMSCDLFACVCDAETKHAAETTHQYEYKTLAAVSVK